MAAGTARSQAGSGFGPDAIQTKMMVKSGISSSPSAASAAPAAKAAGMDMPVMIIDDDSGVRRSHTRILERAGFTVSSFDNALAAFAELQKEQSYGAILLHIRMPRLSGIGLFEQLEERLPHMASRVVFLSAFVDQHKTRELLELTGQPFLAKPSNLDQLVGTVRRMVERSARESGRYTPNPGYSRPEPGHCEPLGWARIWPTVKRSVSRTLKRGAWYPVMDEPEPEKVMLLISGSAVAIPRHILQVRPRRPRPHRFTVVYRTASEPNPVGGTAADLGRTYAVCPQCAARSKLFAHPLTHSCRDCGHKAEVAWWETG